MMQRLIVVGSFSLCALIYLTLGALMLLSVGCGGGDGGGNQSPTNQTTTISCYKGDTIYTFDSSGNLISTAALDASSETEALVPEEEARLRFKSLDNAGLIIAECGSTININAGDATTNVDNSETTTNLPAEQPPA